MTNQYHVQCPFKRYLTAARRADARDGIIETMSAKTDNDVAWLSLHGYMRQRLDFEVGGMKWSMRSDALVWTWMEARTVCTHRLVIEEHRKGRGKSKVAQRQYHPQPDSRGADVCKPEIIHSQGPVRDQAPAWPFSRLLHLDTITALPSTRVQTARVSLSFPLCTAIHAHPLPGEV
ncbi:hypothetical protein MRB53_037659 [Persea americana]|nr:hypothetical protein MRB53_037659 [Persea americana]